MSKLQNKIKALKEDDFLPGWFDSWQIFIKDAEYSLERHYMKTGFQSEEQANKEKDRIIRHYNKNDKPLFSVIVRPVKVRRLKKPISVG